MGLHVGLDCFLWIFLVVVIFIYFDLLSIMLFLDWLTSVLELCIRVLNVFGCLYTDNCKEVVITGYTQAEARSLS